MTKDKKTMLGIVAAVGAILGYAYYKKKKDLTDSGADELITSYFRNAEIPEETREDLLLYASDNLPKYQSGDVLTEEDKKRFGLT